MRSIVPIMLAVALTSCGKNSSPHRAQSLPHPSDEFMTETLVQNQQSFAELLRLFTTSGAAEVRLGQIAELDPLMKRLGVQMIHVRGQTDPQIEFTATTTGWVTGGSGKAYVWSETSRRPLVDNLDEYAKAHRHFFVYKALTNGWYICYQSTE